MNKDLNENANEMLTSLVTFRENYNLLMIKEKNLALLIKKSKLRFLPVFEKYHQSNYKLLDENESYAKTILENKINL